MSYSLAHPAHIMIASIRDGLYRKQLQQLAQEVAEDLLGGRRATVLAPEVALAADLLYYAVTTVSGTQTIGEEFVHILRAQRYKVEVKGSSVEMIRPLGTATRVLVCFCQCLMPYLASRSAIGWHTLVTEFQLPDDARALRYADREARELILDSDGVHADPTGGGTGVASGSGDGGSEEASAGAPSHAHQSAASHDDAVPQWVPLGFEHVYTVLRERLRQLPIVWMAVKYHMWHHAAELYVWFRRHWTAVSARLPPSLSAWVPSALRVLNRLHTATFYMTGSFYDVAMRLFGVYYVVHGAHQPGLPSYRTLGLLALASLGMDTISTGASAAAAAWRARRRRAAGGEGSTGVSEAGAAGAGAATSTSASGEDGDQSEEDGIRMERSRILPSVKRGERASPYKLRKKHRNRPDSAQSCSLCLSTCRYATATECGHVFCWMCIMRWVQSKPECPLCRHPSPPRSLLCVYGF